MMLEDQNLAIMFNKINHFADASLQLNATVNTNHYITFISTDLDISSNKHVQFLCQARLDSFQHNQRAESRYKTWSNEDGCHRLLFLHSLSFRPKCRHQRRVCIVHVYLEVYLDYTIQMIMGKM